MDSGLAAATEQVDSLEHRVAHRKTPGHQHVVLAAEDGAEVLRPDACELTPGPLEALVWDEAAGRMTRNGLGSLEIGAGKTRVDE